MAWEQSGQKCFTIAHLYCVHYQWMRRSNIPKNLIKNAMDHRKDLLNTDSLTSPGEILIRCPWF